MTKKPIQKAYKIDFSKIEEGYLSDEIICYADNRSKAKAELLKRVIYDDWLVIKDQQPLNYLNIPVVRYPHADKILFRGEWKTNTQIWDIVENEKRVAALDKILEDQKIKYCYISKGLYYRPGSRGYTSHITEAGIFPKEEAVSHAKSVREITIYAVDIAEHNKLIQEKIDELKTRLLD